MEATKLVNRDVYEISYAAGEGALIKATLTNPETGDVSEYGGLDDGSFIVTVATDYDGVADVVVTDPNGHVLDSGTVAFGDAEVPEAPEEPGDDEPHPAHPIA